MKILVTGANGFIGKNLTMELNNQGFSDLMLFDIGLNETKLDEFCRKAEFVYHLAGVNRPKDQAEFMEGNAGFTSVLLNTLQKHQNACPVMLASSIQAEMDNPYGKSKRAGEHSVFTYSEKTGANVFVYRFPNVFGKWCRPNYNSAVATFCYNIARGLDITVSDPKITLSLVYIDDVVSELIGALKGQGTKDGDFYKVPVVHTASLGEIVSQIQSFKAGRTTRYLPDVGDAFKKKLYSTYLSYLDETDFVYDLVMNKDTRGSFTEFLRSECAGQVSVNVSRLGITKGDHWHHTKTEKFLVVAGNGAIRFKKPGDDNVIEYLVSGEKMQIVDVPPGYAHSIVNLGDSDMVTLIWCNECFDPGHPDTYSWEV